MNGKIDLTILIPAYNESRRLPATLEKVHSYCAVSLQITYEILVVDDGSTDDTASVVEQMRSRIPNLKVHRYSQNHGKGYALRVGMHLARGRFVVFMDADLSTPIEELERFLQSLNGGAPVVIATRKSPGANITTRQPLIRESMGKAFTWLSNTILGIHFSDLTCGFKAFESSVGKDLFSRQVIEGWAYDSEILFLASRAGYQVIEIPVTWINSPDSRVRMFRDVFSSLTSLLQIRWNWWTRKYELEKSSEPGRIPADV